MVVKVCSSIVPAAHFVVVSVLQTYNFDILYKRYRFSFFSRWDSYLGLFLALINACIYTSWTVVFYSSRCPKIFGEGLKYELKIFGLTCTIFIFMRTVLL
jgi:hypothetical protein